MKTSILIAGAVLTSAAFALPSKTTDECASSQAKTVAWTEKPSIVETAVAAGNFKTLAAALQAADLVDALSGKGPFTVFAPTDEAFAKLPKGTLENLLKPENKGLLTNILTFHVAAGNMPAAAVVKADSATALNGQRISFQIDDNGVQAAGARVVKTDIECGNGIIHVVDTVMMPATDDIIETAVAAGSFKTLAAALKAGGLIEALQGDGPFTVFAPTDEAFASLPDGTVESLLKPENKDRLVAILKYHVVSGRVYANQLENGQKAGTLQGSPVAVRIADGKVTISGATVAAADIETTNGVIHVIDKVLLPQQ